MRNTKYPEFVRAFRPKGTCVKKIGKTYYVYRVTSKRLPGRKSPVPQTGPLLGYIDEQGYHEKTRQIVDMGNVVSYEYGYTAFLLLHENDFVSAVRKSHPKLLIRELKEVFRNVILILSPYSILNVDSSFERKTAEELHTCYGISVCAMSAQIAKLMPIDEKIESGLKCLGCIRTDGNLILSSPCDALREHLGDVGITEEDLRSVRARIAA